MIKPQIYATVGISGSGKTTWAQRYVDEYDNWVLIDTDAIRAELWGDASDQRNGSEVFRVAYERMNAALSEGINVIFCATSTTLRARDSLRAAITVPATLTFVWFPVAVEECLKRNAARDRHVPEEVIRRQHQQFQFFTEAEKYFVIVT